MHIVALYSVFDLLQGCYNGFLTLTEQCFHVEVRGESFVYAVLCQHSSAP